MVQEGFVSALYVFEQKGMAGRTVTNCRFIQNLGMEGDRHARGGARQVTMLAGEAESWMKEQDMQGLCFQRYKANIVTRGISLEHAGPGTRILMGTAVFEVSECMKECFPECSLFQRAAECRLSSAGIYLKVTETGQVSKNDKIVIIA